MARLSPEGRKAHDAMRKAWVERWPKSARANVMNAVVTGAGTIAGSMQRLVPVDSGDLKNSIRVVEGDYTPDNPNVRGMQATSGTGPLAVSIVAGDAKAWYARLVEYGTVRSRAQSFFWSAWRANIKAVRAAIRRAFKKSIKDGSIPPVPGIGHNGGPPI